jgi:hypothetical protein
MLPFWISIAVLSLAQGAIVALARPPSALRLSRLRGRRWAVIPPLSVIGFVFVAGTAAHASAQGLTYLALVAVPLLAAAALGWLTPRSRALNALLVLPLFALAWAERGALSGEAAALVLSALSCVTLGVLLAVVTPPRWLAAGVVAMAVADAALVISDLLQRPNDALNAAHPAAGLPKLQNAVFGSALIGYGDLFIAGVLGALLASTLGRSSQLRAAGLAAALALAFDLLFFLVDELPATVPVALTLIVVIVRRRRSAHRGRARAPQVSAEHPRGSSPLAPPPPPRPLPAGERSPGSPRRSRAAP